MKIVEVTKKSLNRKPKHEVEEMIQKMKKEYEKPVKGKFEFTEARGGVFEFSERIFPGQPVMVYSIRHDETVIIPKGVAKRLNNTQQKVRVQNHEIGEMGSVRGVPDSTEKFSRVKFIPEEYL